jgi:hypothetical protein
MAMMEYDSVRRFHHHNSFDVPNYHYENRDNHIPLSYETSSSSRTYPIGRHVRSRAGIEKDELQGLNMENGPARRRIAVAVSFTSPVAQLHFTLISQEFKMVC